jgi:Zn-dependent protease with chaperone function
MGVITAGVGVVIVLVYTTITVWFRQSQYLGRCARVSEKQFPQIYSIAREAASRLTMNQPDVFIEQDPTLNAYAIGFIRKKCVVLHSAIAEAMEKPELEFIIGHEFSHIKCGHTNLVVITSSAEGVNVPIVTLVLHFVFLRWSRKAEYTCDRGGLLACRDPRAAAAALCKLAVGPVLYKQMNIEDFMRQQSAITHNDLSELCEKFETHPYLVKRIRAVREFYESDQCRRLIGNDGSSDSAQPITIGQPRNGHDSDGYAESSHELVCTNCGTICKLQKPGSKWMLWTGGIMIVVGMCGPVVSLLWPPGLILVIIGYRRRKPKCLACAARNLIPRNSPKGRELTHRVPLDRSN